MRSLPSLVCLLAALFHSSVANAAGVAEGVRGIATRAPKEMKIDGDLAEFKDAFCTPINYFHPDLKNRPAQFFYMWDDDAFYAGLRTLDERPANNAPDDRLWEGDGVEWYFDTRQDARFRSLEWENSNNGSVHCYWTGLANKEVKPRFCLRPGYLDAIPKLDIGVGARRTKFGMEVEFKLPWKNFRLFKAEFNRVIAIDAELCYSDGGPRVDRFFAYGSPLSVQQPASLAKVQLVEKLEREHWKACGPVMMPVRVDTAWGQPGKPNAQAWITLPPNQESEIGKIVIRLTDLEGKTIGEHEAKTQVIQADGSFKRALAQWPNDSAAPGAFHATAIVFDKDGKELTRIAPRLVSTSMQQGY